MIRSVSDVDSSRTVGSDDTRHSYPTGSAVTAAEPHGGRTVGQVNSRVDRQRDDACPGALHVHQAADGVLARIRLPGGMITAAQLETLAHAATRHGSGTWN